MKLGLIVAAMLICSACDRIPGTNAYKRVQIEAAKKQRQAAFEKEILEAEGLAAYNLYDPNSAQFRETFQGRNGFPNDEWKSTHIVCGQLNARNRLGAYIGFVRFMADVSTKKLQVEQVDPPTLATDSSAFSACLSSLRAGEDSDGPTCKESRDTREKEVEETSFLAAWALRCSERYKG